ncbi:MAG TPA: hypothetical protein VFO69_10270 [Allosphingosinicella sp.]|nr:hypothetical protein [Allosphingosinicella sp.]
MKLGSRLIVGAIAGVIGTMAMTSAMRRLHRRLPPEERYPLTPREIIDSAVDPEEEPGRDLTTISHFAYGAGCGALVAAANSRPGVREGAGAGVAIWLASYMGWIPAVGLLKPANRHPVRRNLLMIGVHLVWGAATALSIRELGAARQTIFAGGADRDVPEAKQADLKTD